MEEKKEKSKFLSEMKLVYYLPFSSNYKDCTNLNISFRIIHDDHVDLFRNAMYNDS